MAFLFGSPTWSLRGRPDHEHHRRDHGRHHQREQRDLHPAVRGLADDLAVLAVDEHRVGPYAVLVHGQNGKIVGKAPYSWVKITLFSLVVAAVVTAVVLVIRASSE